MPTEYRPRPIRRKLKTKICGVCKRRKPLLDFYYHKARKIHMWSCRKCCDKRVVKRYKDNKNSPQQVFTMRAGEITRRCKIKRIPCMKKLGAYLYKLWVESKGKCFYTNKDMSLKGYHTMNPDFVTVDRRKSELGYIEGNIVLCCSIINRIKTNLSGKDLISLCKEILKNQERFA